MPYLGAYYLFCQALEIRWTEEKSNATEMHSKIL